MNGKSASGVIGTVLALTTVLTLVWTESVQAGVCSATNAIQDPTEFQWTPQSGYYMGTLEFGAATLNIGGATLTTRAYRQAGGSFSIPGPTIRMTPGNTYVLTLKNLLPYAPASTAENTFKDPNVTNVHTHGLHVSPMSPSDDVLRLINGGYCGDYVYDVPSDHMGGTLWYHPHHHGSTFLQVSGGAWGLLLIDDVFDGVPAGVAAMTERQLVIGYVDPSVAGTGGDTLISGTLSPTWTVNGAVNGSLCMPANEWERWRVLVADADAMERSFAVGPNCEVALLARDGVWRSVAPLAIPARSLQLTGASRADLAVRCSADSTISVGGTIVANVIADATLPPDTSVGPYSNGATGGTWSAQRPTYLRDLRGIGSVESRTVNMGARTVNGSKFDMHVPTFSIPTGAIQEWTVKGAAAHPFHLHVYHFQMQSTCGAFEAGEYYDTLSASPCMTRFDLNPATSSVYDGTTIMHCHILDHEDNGAMGWADVIGGFAPPSFPDPSFQELYQCGSTGCTPTENPEVSCMDGIDNDCDGSIDAADLDCATGMACSNYADKASCNADPNCVWQGSPKNGTCVDSNPCSPTASSETGLCADGVDNDCDGATDCADGDCSADLACAATGCDNDTVCEAGEDCLNCSNDCLGVISGKPANRYCCGNGILEVPEGDGTICDGNP